MAGRRASGHTQGEREEKNDQERLGFFFVLYSAPKASANYFFCLYGHSLVQQGKAMRAKLTHYLGEGNRKKGG
jgi:hypothetical protein